MSARIILIFCSFIATSSLAFGNDELPQKNLRWSTNEITLAIQTNEDQSEIVRWLFRTSMEDFAAISEATKIVFQFSSWTAIKTDGAIFISVFDPTHFEEFLPQLQRKFPENPILDEVTSSMQSLGTACVFSVILNDNSDIVEAIILTSSNSDYGYCVRRNLVHVLGLIDQNPAGLTSIRSLDSVPRNVTGLDLVDLRELYK